MGQEELRVGEKMAYEIVKFEGNPVIVDLICVLNLNSMEQKSMNKHNPEIHHGNTLLDRLYPQHIPRI